MMRHACLIVAVAALVGCSPKKVTPAPSGAVAPSRSVPDHLFGVTLRRPLDTAAVFGVRCLTGRQFATLGGSYDIVSDDILASAVSEHQDTTAVLAALDSLTACITRTRELGATVVITLSDSVVGHVVAYWPRGDGPSYDSMVAILTNEYGVPYQNSWGVRFWSADSMAIYVNKRSFFGEGTSVTLSDARLCGRYERLVHQNNTRDFHSYPCWEKPERLDPGEVFTDRPVMLGDSDLVVAKVAFRADSGQVRRALGAPASTDSVSWTYPDLRIWLQYGKANIIVLTTPKYATARGLRVGDPVARAKPLYGTPCIRELWVYCRSSLDEREGHGIMLKVENHVIMEIRVGVTVVSE